MSITARLSLRSDVAIEQSRLEPIGPFTSAGVDEPTYGTTGVADDLVSAAELAVRHMSALLHEERGLTRAEGYLLCSVAVDRR